MTVYNFLSKLDNCLTSKCCSLFFVFVHVELFHGVGGYVLALVLWTVLDSYLTLDTRKGFLDYLFQGIFNES
jgi:hypothetical protein